MEVRRANDTVLKIPIFPISSFFFFSLVHLFLNEKRIKPLFIYFPQRVSKCKEFTVYLLVCLVFDFPVAGSSSTTDPVGALCLTAASEMSAEEPVCTID